MLTDEYRPNMPRVPPMSKKPTDLGSVYSVGLRMSQNANKAPSSSVELQWCHSLKKP